MSQAWPVLNTDRIKKLRNHVASWAERIDAKTTTPAALARQHCVPLESVVYAIANFYFDMGKPREALALVNQVLDVRPDPRLHILRIRIRMAMPKENNDKLLKDMAQLAALHFPARPQSATAFGGRDLSPDRRLNLGFVCTFSSTWSIITALIPLLLKLDRAHFKVTFFSVGRIVAPEWVAKSADECVYVLDPGADAVCRAIADKQIDLLFDLSGYLMQDFPLEAYLRRPAPVQVSWWNAPLASDAGIMQYFLSEEGIVPEKYRRHFAEKICLLKGGAAVGFEFPEYPLTPPPHARQPSFTFASFTALYKINDEVLSTWGEILQKAPNARLLLKALHADTPYFRKRVELALQPYKIDPARIGFEGATTFNDTMLKYTQADLCLSPFGWSAATTAVNTLWQGVPTLAMDGELLHSAASADCMRKAGLPQFVAASRGDYIQKAVHYAKNPEELAAIRSDIRARLKQTSRYNPGLFVRGFEEACRFMWQDWLKDLSAAAKADSAA